MTIEELLHICTANGLRLSPSAGERLEAYAEQLRSWNSRINLISRQDEANILSRHILHSLTLRMPAICDYDFTNKEVADVGTGGGLPGIPLKIVTPSATLTLIDSIQKKITACNDMITSLGLSGIRGVPGRSEDLAKLPEYSHCFDAIVSRAVAPLEDLMQWTQGLLKPGGAMYSFKGGDLREEIKRASRLKYVAEIDERPLFLKEYDLFEKEGKKLICVRLHTNSVTPVDL